MLFVNYKTYEESSGQKALDLTNIIESVAGELHVKIIPVVQALDAESVIKSTKLPVWIQHIDPIRFGSHTGWTLPSEVKEIGIEGVFLNHSEHKFSDPKELANAVSHAKEVNLKTLIFAAGIEELGQILKLEPDYCSYEPPELVGSETDSVAQSKPELISQAVEISKKASTPLIVGAGIKSANDVRKSVELGATGVAVASAIVKAEDQKEKLMELAEALNS